MLNMAHSMVLGKDSAIDGNMITLAKDKPHLPTLLEFHAQAGSMDRIVSDEFMRILVDSYQSLKHKRVPQPGEIFLLGIRPVIYESPGRVFNIELASHQLIPSNIKLVTTGLNVVDTFTYDSVLVRVSRLTMRPARVTLQRATSAGIIHVDYATLACHLAQRAAQEDGEGVRNPLASVGR